MPQLHNIKHEAFCQTYVRDDSVRLNATRSYMKVYPRASYTTALVNGPRLLGKTRNRVIEIILESRITEENFLETLARLLDAKKPVFRQGRLIGYWPDWGMQLKAAKLGLRLHGIRV